MFQLKTFFNFALLSTLNKIHTPKNHKSKNRVNDEIYFHFASKAREILLIIAIRDLLLKARIETDWGVINWWCVQEYVASAHDLYLLTFNPGKSSSKAIYTQTAPRKGSSFCDISYVAYEMQSMICELKRVFNECTLVNL